jgi:hypothetical protein
MNTRYIVVLFYQGIGHTLQTDDKPRIFFSKDAKVYKNLGSAIKRANKLFYQYCNDNICVFKVVLDERLSCDQYMGWYKDENRLMWNSSKWF